MLRTPLGVPHVVPTYYCVITTDGDGRNNAMNI